MWLGLRWTVIVGYVMFAEDSGERRLGRSDFGLGGGKVRIGLAGLAVVWRYLGFADPVVGG